jgi:hypothetical protein
LVDTVFLDTNCIVNVLERLNVSKLDLNHLFTFIRLSLSLVSKVWRLLSITRRLVSSAKRTDIALSTVARVRSLMYNKNNRGPRTEP